MDTPSSPEKPTRRVLLPSGTAPVVKRRLLSANGAAIAPKTLSPALKTSAAPVVEDAEAIAAAEAAAAEEQARYEREIAEYQQQMEAYEKQMAEEAAAAKAAEEEAAAAAKAAQEAAAAKAAEQVAAAQAAAEEAAKIAEAAAKAAEEAATLAESLQTAPSEEPAEVKEKAPEAKAPAAAKAPTVAKAAPVLRKKVATGATTSPLLKKSTLARPAAAPASESVTVAEGEIPAEENAERSAEEIEREQRLIQMRTVQPIWKKPYFIVGCVGLAILGGGVTYNTVSKNAAHQAMVDRRNETNRLLHQASNINKVGAETLADVTAKNIKLDCTVEDAALLMGVIVDPDQKDSNGNKLYGNNSDGVAMNAGLLLGIMVEKTPAIEKLVFESLRDNASKIKPALFSWMLQRIGIADVKNINAKLRALSSTIAAQEKFKTKSIILASIWEVIGLRVSPKDLDPILKMLKSDVTDKVLANSLSINLDNIIDMTDDAAERKRIGNEIFENAPEKYRYQLLSPIAKSCSDKAWAFYKKGMLNQDNWPEAMYLLGAWGSDEHVPYLLEMNKATPDNPYIMKAIASTLVQSRDRDDKTAKSLMDVLFDKLDEDTSEYQDVLNKTDPDAGDFVGKKSPQYAKLMEKRKDLETCRKQKISLMNTLASLQECNWALKIAKRYTKDGDRDVKIAAEDALEAMKKNTERAKELKENYNKRQQAS